MEEILLLSVRSIPLLAKRVNGKRFFEVIYMKFGDGMTMCLKLLKVMEIFEPDLLVPFMVLRCTVYKVHPTGLGVGGSSEKAWDVFWFDYRVPLVNRATYKNYSLWEARQVAEAMNANAYGVGVYA